MKKAIVAFSFGRIADLPNLSSSEIALLIARHVERQPSVDHVIIAQWEVAMVLEKEGVTCDHIVRMKPEGYLSSRDIADAAYAYLQEAGITPSEVYAAAHPDHVDRCIRCLRNAGLIGGLPLTKQSMPYDPRSTEIWVRSRKLFLFRELLAAPIYAWRKELW